MHQTPKRFLFQYFLLDSAPSYYYKMTVIQLFIVCPAKYTQDIFHFGVIPFLLFSTMPDISNNILMFNATSTKAVIHCYLIKLLLIYHQSMYLSITITCTYFQFFHMPHLDLHQSKWYYYSKTIYPVMNIIRFCERWRLV